MTIYISSLVPTPDELLLLEGMVEKKDEEGKEVQGLRVGLKARIWKGITNTGHSVEVAIVHMVSIDPQDQENLTARLKEIGWEGHPTAEEYREIMRTAEPLPTRMDDPGVMDNSEPSESPEEEG